jgi:hypothetical protein
MRLPPGAGEYSNKILRLTRSIYGLRGASKAFMKQLGSEVESFSEKVEYKDADGKMKVECARFERLVRISGLGRQQWGPTLIKL